MSPTPPSNKSYSNSMINGSFTGDDLIQDENELGSYLKEVSKKERKSTHLNADQPSNLLSSFWLHPPSGSPNDISPLLRRCAYQLAPTVGK